MLTRRPPFVHEGNDRIMMQDGFSAPVASVPRPRLSSACAMVGRHVMDFSDNGDGALTVQQAFRSIEQQNPGLTTQDEVSAVLHREEDDAASATSAWKARSTR